MALNNGLFRRNGPFQWAIFGAARSIGPADRAHAEARSTGRKQWPFPRAGQCNGPTHEANGTAACRAADLHAATIRPRWARGRVGCARRVWAGASRVSYLSPAQRCSAQSSWTDDPAAQDGASVDRDRSPVVSRTRCLNFRSSRARAACSPLAVFLSPMPRASPRPR